MKKTNKLINDYRDYTFSSGGYTGEDFKSFARKYKNVIKEQIGEKGEIVKWSPNHYDLSGFIRHNNTGNLVYFSISDVRWSDDWFNSVLIRTAEHDRDFRGGHNNFTPLTEFGQMFEELVG